MFHSQVVIANNVLRVLSVGISMDFNCTSFLADSVLYLYEADVMQGFLRKNNKRLTRSFNFTFRYIYYFLSLNDSKLGDFVDRIDSIELEVKDTTYTARTASYLDLDLHLNITSECQLRRKLYDKRDDFDFPIVDFPFICSNIPSSICMCSIYLSVDTIFQSLWFL